jgi:formylglycine-generating enzyme required for sulfatase activity/tRNA A-37 threonylcarbamoyl transferase component Bud32
MAEKADEPLANAQVEKTAPIIANFQLLKLVGQGGMGKVYRAKQLSVDRIVAVKILKPNLARDRKFLDRFKEEARAAAKLNHPNIVQAIDAGEAGGYFYFAMEFVDGETMHRLMLREGLMDENKAVKIALDTAHALGHAHLHGIVHRDVKPGNIMISKEGLTKLCDLGLAQLQEEAAASGRGPAIGTPYYISPEQAQGYTNVDCRSDIYSLGATLYRALAGRPAFDAPTRAEILEKHVHTPLPWPKDHNPALSDTICYIVAKMMMKKPEQRYQTPDELAEDLERLTRGETPKTATVDLGISPSKLTEEERAAVAMTAARIRRKREAIEQLREVRVIIDRVAAEKAIPPHAVVNLLHINRELDEAKPETFMKYGVILLAERRFQQARREFRQAARLGGDVSAYLDKLDALGTPPGMAYVPGGEFIAGPPDAPQRLELPAFYMDINLVTNRKYLDFMRATGAAAPSYWIEREVPERAADHPVVDISWDQARAYAQWAGKRLPTSAEWQKAARGADGRAYPWGNDFEPLRCNTSESGIGELTAAGRYPRGISPYGCCDMIGNVLQWCQDSSPTSPEGPDNRALCGVSYGEPGATSGCWRVEFRKRNRRSRTTGFRCAMDI